jgi:hypothetical protein
MSLELLRDDIGYSRRGTYSQLLTVRGYDIVHAYLGSADCRSSSPFAFPKDAAKPVSRNLKTASPARGQRDLTREDLFPKCRGCRG